MQETTENIQFLTMQLGTRHQPKCKLFFFEYIIDATDSYTDMKSRRYNMGYRHLTYEELGTMDLLLQWNCDIKLATGGGLTIIAANHGILATANLGRRYGR